MAAKMLFFRVLCFFYVAVIIGSCQENYLKLNELKSDFLKNAIFNTSTSLKLTDEDVGQSSASTAYNNATCQIQLAYMAKNMFKPNVLPYFDAWGVLPSGLLSLNLADFGNFDQCIKINSNLARFESKGQYCIAKVPIMTIPSQMSNSELKRLNDVVTINSSSTSRDMERNLIIPISIGICVPSACHPAIVAKFLTAALPAPIRVDTCSTDETPALATLDWVAIAIVCSVLLLATVSTAYDYLAKSNDSFRSELLRSFSLIANGRKLFHVSYVKNPKSIDCLHGIRALSMLWVLLGHTYAYNMSWPLVNLIEVLNWLRSPYSMLVQNGTLSVDSFFFLSGLLISWMALQEMEKNKGRLNVPMMYIHRLLRLLPMLLIMIIFIISLLKFFGKGPLWEKIGMAGVEGCSAYWWHSVLFIQVYTQKMCIGQTWYLSVDMQLYIVAPLILIPLWKWRAKFLPVLAILIFASAGYVFSLFYKYGFTNVIIAASEERMKYVYMRPYTRCSPWIIGIATGYLLFVYRDKRIRIHKGLVVVGWIIAISVIGTVLFGPLHTTDLKYTPTIFEAAIYEVLSKIAWAICLAWIVFACHTGYGGLINSFLSYPWWQIISRLTYCMFMIHITVLDVNFGNLRTGAHFSDYEVILEFWAAFGICLLISVPIVLLFESPLIAIEKLLLKRPKATVKMEFPENVIKQSPDGKTSQQKNV